LELDFMLQSMTAIALDAFVPPLAPIVLLLFLGTGFTVFCALVGAAIASAARRRALARTLGGAALAAGVVYGVLLLAASLLSRERTLAAGERKYFCEMDCHLAYSVESASSAEGSVRIAIRTWFDPSTIASFRGSGPLSPNPRALHLVDGAGRRYATADPVAPLSQPLRPGESYLSSFAFAVPAGVGPLRLFVGDAPGLENLIVNHENSPFHARTYFALPAQTASAASRRPERRP
jgi:hypothetical protein